MAIFAGSTLLGALSAAGTISTGSITGESVTLGRALTYALPGWWYWGVVTPLVVAVARRWSFEARAGRCFLVHGGLAIVCAALHGVVLVTATRIAFPGQTAALMWWTIYGNFVASRLPLDVITYAALLGVALTLAGQRKLRTRELVEAELRGELTQAQLEALRMQLQPHFLFNTLHAVGVLTRENPPAAERVLALLGDLLRVTLSRRASQLVRLEEELGVLESYLEIERTRFADRLQVQINVPQSLKAVPVPQFVLQPLVENAIRHGIAARPQGGQIRVSAYRVATSTVLEVWNDGGWLTQPRGDEGIGLSTTRARLHKLYGREAVLELENAPGGGVLARLTLPAAGGANG